MSTISRKNQVTLPKDVLEAAGLSAGDAVLISTVSPGRIELVKAGDVVAEFAGRLGRGVYPPGYLEEVRGGWP